MSLLLDVHMVVVVVVGHLLQRLFVLDPVLTGRSCLPKGQALLSTSHWHPTATSHAVFRLAVLHQVYAVQNWHI